mmetsp:Transcript_23729/g.46269  ORF Transcript_23729/g.46269 Transcript_23729/m.46269 type:complete len:105 (+) Transcript_23729:767-1081(+)
MPSASVLLVRYLADAAESIRDSSDPKTKCQWQTQEVYYEPEDFTNQEKLVLCVDQGCTCCEKPIKINVLEKITTECYEEFDSTQAVVIDVIATPYYCAPENSVH